jgi:hypothetical protein
MIAFVDTIHHQVARTPFNFAEVGKSGKTAFAG